MARQLLRAACRSLAADDGAMQAPTVRIASLVAAWRAVETQVGTLLHVNACPGNMALPNAFVWCPAQVALAWWQSGASLVLRALATTARDHAQPLQHPQGMGPPAVASSASQQQDMKRTGPRKGGGADRPSCGQGMQQGSIVEGVSGGLSSSGSGAVAGTARGAAGHVAGAASGPASTSGGGSSSSVGPGPGLKRPQGNPGPRPAQATPRQHQSIGRAMQVLNESANRVRSAWKHRAPLPEASQAQLQVRRCQPPDACMAVPWTCVAVPLDGRAAA